MDSAVHKLSGGLQFSHDIGNGGSLFATLVAKSLLADHLRIIVNSLRSEHLTAAQRSQLQSTVAGLGRGLDWSMAAKCDLEALRRDYGSSSQTSAALSRIIDAYVAVLDDKSNLPAVTQPLETAPKDLANVVPHIENVLKQKQDLTDMIRQTRFVLR